MSLLEKFLPAGSRQHRQSSNDLLPLALAYRMFGSVSDLRDLLNAIK